MELKREAKDLSPTSVKAKPLDGNVSILFLNFREEEEEEEEEVHRKIKKKRDIIYDAL